MKRIFMLFTLSLIFIGCKNQNRENQEENQNGEMTKAAENSEEETKKADVNIEPIEHATAIISWDDAVFYIDPVGGAKAFEGKENPDFILITDIHGDHMNAETLQALELSETKIFVPQAVKNELPEDMHDMLMVIENGGSEMYMDFSIQAIPMYNLPEDDPETYHQKGRGNGYIVEKDNTRLYISGDTEGIPEMRNLENIDIALICMNLPYTMDIEQAADAVLDFEPEKVYPYHFRGQNGLADVNTFKEMVEQGNDNIKVEILDWYPEGINQ